MIKKHGTNLYQQVKQINSVKTTSQELVTNQSKVLNLLWNLQI